MEGEVTLVRGTLWIGEDALGLRERPGAEAVARLDMHPAKVLPVSFWKVA